LPDLPLICLDHHGMVIYRGRYARSKVSVGHADVKLLYLLVVKKQVEQGHFSI